MLFILCIIIIYWNLVVESTHFYGGTVTWKPMNNTATGSKIPVMFTQSYQWRRSYNGAGCNQTTIMNQSPLIPNTGSSLSCTTTPTCGGFTSLSINEYCTDYSVLVDSSAGSISYVENITAGAEFCVAYSGQYWVQLYTTVGCSGRKKRSTPTTTTSSTTTAAPGCFSSNAGWSIGTCVNLTLRPDGFIDTPPVATVISPIKVPVNTITNINIPVIDADNDYLRCRWAEQTSDLNECGDVCQTAPGSTLEDNCTIIFNSTGKTVGTYYAVTLMVEDFYNSTTDTPFNSVPIQFLIYIVGGINCTSKPTISSSLPACTPIEVGSQLNFSLTILQGCPGTTITDVFTMPPQNVYKGALTQNGTSNVWILYETWTPTELQLGAQVFCAVATDSSNVQSDQYCTTFTVVPAGSSSLCPGQTSTTSTTTTTPVITTTTSSTSTSSTATTSSTSKSTTTSKTTTKTTTSSTTSTTTKPTSSTSTSTSSTSSTTSTTSTSTSTSSTSSTTSTTTKTTSSTSTSTSSTSSTTSTTTKTTSSTSTSTSSTSSTTSTTSTSTSTSSTSSTTSTTSASTSTSSTSSTTSTATTTTTSTTSSTSSTSSTTSTTSTTSSTSSTSSTTSTTSTSTTSTTSSTSSTSSTTSTTSTSTTSTTSSTSSTTSTTSTTSTSTTSTTSSTSSTTSTTSTTSTSTTSTTSSTSSTTSTTSTTATTTTSTSTSTSTTSSATTSTSTTTTATTATTATTTSTLTTAKHTNQINIPLIVGLSLLALLAALTLCCCFYWRFFAPAVRRRQLNEENVISRYTRINENSPRQVNVFSPKYYKSSKINKISAVDPDDSISQQSRTTTTNSFENHTDQNLALTQTIDGIRSRSGKSSKNANMIRMNQVNKPFAVKDNIIKCTSVSEIDLSQVSEPKLQEDTSGSASSTSKARVIKAPKGRSSSKQNRNEFESASSKSTTTINTHNQSNELKPNHSPKITVTKVKLLNLPSQISNELNNDTGKPLSSNVHHIETSKSSYSSGHKTDELFPKPGVSESTNVEKITRSLTATTNSTVTKLKRSDVSSDINHNLNAAPNQSSAKLQGTKSHPNASNSNVTVTRITSKKSST